MKAEEASEISFKAVSKIDVSYYLGRIKEAAEAGAFSVQFGILDAGAINALRQRGYSVEDGWGSTTVRWAPQLAPISLCAPCPPSGGIYYK